jgi:hypothetical protein
MVELFIFVFSNSDIGRDFRCKNRMMNCKSLLCNQSGGVEFKKQKIRGWKKKNHFICTHKNGPRKTNKQLKRALTNIFALENNNHGLREFFFQKMMIMSNKLICSHKKNAVRLFDSPFAGEKGKGKGGFGRWLKIIVFSHISLYSIQYIYI